MILDEICNLCLGVERTSDGSEAVLLECNDGDPRQLFNFDDEYNDKFLLVESYENNDMDDLCLTMPDCYIDDGDDGCDSNEDLPPLFLHDCKQEDTEDDKYQEFRYDRSSAPTDSITPSDDADLCLTFSVFDSGDLAEEDNLVVLSDCNDLDDSERMWRFDDNYNAGRDCDSGDIEDKYHLIVLQEDRELCLGVNEAEEQAEVRLVECVSYDSDASDDDDLMLQQWAFKEGKSSQTWKSRIGEYCVKPINGNLKLANCDVSQDLIWKYDEDSDAMIHLWARQDLCVAPYISRRRSLLRAGLGNRGRDGGNTVPGGRTASLPHQADRLVLTQCTNAYYTFEVINTDDYKGPIGRSEAETFKKYRLNDGNMCVGVDEIEAGQYLRTVKCRSSDKGQLFKISNNQLKWESRLLEDPNDSSTSLCVKAVGGGGNRYLRLDYCNYVSDNWAYSSKMITLDDDSNSCVTYCNDYTQSSSAKDGDVLCLKPCNDLDSEDREWYAEDPN